MPEEIMCPGGEVHVVEAGETMWILSRRYGITLDALVAANPHIEDPAELQVGDRVCIPMMEEECPGFMYTIRRGDTFYDIAKRYNTTVSALIRYNPEADPQNLQIGEEICVPVMPPDIEGKRCLLLTPGDMTPDANGIALIDFDRNTVTVLANDLPDPEEFDDCKTYKMWVRYRPTREWAGVEMEELEEDMWVGKIEADLPVERHDLIRVTPEMYDNEERPIGVTVLSGNIERLYRRM